MWAGCWLGVCWSWHPVSFREYLDIKNSETDVRFKIYRRYSNLSKFKIKGQSHDNSTLWI